MEAHRIELELQSGIKAAHYTADVLYTGAELL